MRSFFCTHAGADHAAADTSTDNATAHAGADHAAVDAGAEYAAAHAGSDSGAANTRTHYAAFYDRRGGLQQGQECSVRRTGLHRRHVLSQRHVVLRG